MLPFTIPGHDQTLVRRYHGAAPWRSGSPDYLRAFRMRLLCGRFFLRAEDERSPVVIINRRMMIKFWPEIGVNPIGEYVEIGKGIGWPLDDPPRQILGVVTDVREASVDREPMMYVPLGQLVDGMTARARAS